MIAMSCIAACGPNAAQPLPDPPPPWTAPTGTGASNPLPRAVDADLGDQGLSIDIEFDKPLSGGLAPPASAFRVVVGGTVQHVTTVVVFGNHVHLTLAAPAVGTTGFVGYVKPATNPLQDATGRQISAFDNLAIT